MDGEKEWPWYDFTLEKGDTWTIEAESPLSRHGEKIEVVVSNVDTITIGGKSLETHIVSRLLFVGGRIRRYGKPAFSYLFMAYLPVPVEMICITIE